MNLKGKTVVITGAAQGLGREMAKELVRYGIRAPGFWDTEMVAAIPPGIQQRITSTIPAGRFGRPEEIARSAFLILEDDYFNGRILEIDGDLRL